MADTLKRQIVRYVAMKTVLYSSGPCDGPSIAELALLTGAPRHSVRARLHELCKLGIVTRSKDEMGVFFTV